MNELVTGLDPLGRDLHQAVARIAAKHTRRRRALRVTATAAALAGVFAAVAVASGIAPDLQLDPTKWSILSSGSVDNGRGQYVHAQDKATGAHSSFSVEHDAGLPRYEAFLLYERVRDAEGTTVSEPGSLCTADQLTRAEVVALATLRSSFSPGGSPNATKDTVDAATQAAFAGSPCRGLEYAGERARFVFAGTEPRAMLMPRAR